MEDRILLVEDDQKIAEGIMDYFEGQKEPIEVEYAMDGNLGMQMIRENSYELVLLDIMLPGRNGFSILREMRRFQDVPVIFITARVREEDRLYGYDLGCDDYVCKPFSLAELYAKVRALIKRARGSIVQEEMQCGEISVHRRTLEVKVKGKKVELMPKELDLLLTLMQRKNWVFSREELLDLIWGMDYEGADRTVDNHIKKLRKKLGPAGAQIKTVYTKGYKICD